ncbi:MAG: CARDB domain-containing protein [Myxococcales bacterium]
MAVVVAGCGSGNPTSGSVGTGQNRCTKDSDCADGRCQSDGTCSIPQTQQQPNACANVACPAGTFCANGQCLPATAQCKPADPACIFIPHGAFEPPVHAWWWPFESPLGPDDPVIGGRVRKDVLFPDFNQVMSTPVVIRLHKDDPEPAIVFNTFSSFTASSKDTALETAGIMRAIRGSDGSAIWTAPKDFPSFEHIIDANSSIAAGDCKGDGTLCLVTGSWDPNDNQPPRAHSHGGLIAFDGDGNLLWENRGNPATGDPEPRVWWGGPAIARLLPDTPAAQIVVGTGVYDGVTGKTMCRQSFPPTGPDQVGGNGDGTLTIIADIDMDGTPEIVTGNNAYKLVRDPTSPTGFTCKPQMGAQGGGVRMTVRPPNCPFGQTRATQGPNAGSNVCLCPNGFEDLCPDGFPALANFSGYGAAMGLNPADTHPVIAVVSKGFLRIQDWTGGILLNPIPLPADPDCNSEFNAGGAPTIADFDGDGLPEIGIAGQGGYVVWKPGPQGFVWRTKTRDCSSNTGSSVFDFEGKGQANVVYTDQCFFRIYDGKTGAALVQEKNASCTAYEMPIVADIDGSGRAKVLVPNNNICNYFCPDWPSGPGFLSDTFFVGLKALASPSDKWVNTRSVWNQHGYHVTNVNLDGSLPFPEPFSWGPGQSNTFRQNVQGQGVFSSPDLSICEVKPQLANCLQGEGTVSATIYNGGAIVAKPGVPVNFYADLTGGPVLIGSSVTKTTLQPGATEEITIPWKTPPQSVSVPIRAVVDEQQKIGDCHPENNTAVSTPVKCSPLG